MKRLFVMGPILVRSAIRGLQTSPVTSGIAVLTISVSLLLLGAFWLLVSNMEGLLEEAGSNLGVVAYFEPDVAPNEQRRIAQRVATAPGVAAVRLVSKDEALERFRRSVGGADLLEGLEENPLPASLEVELQPASRTPTGLARVSEALDGLPGVAELSAGQEWALGYSRAIALVRTLAIGLGGVLGIAALLIVANTIRLALYSREDEIDIYALVGGSRSFVRIPFLLEGSIQGALGGALAVALLYGLFTLLASELRTGLGLLLGNVPPHFFSPGEAATLAAAGAGLGLLGAVTAVAGRGRGSLRP